MCLPTSCRAHGWMPVVALPPWGRRLQVIGPSPGLAPPLEAVALNASQPPATSRAVDLRAVLSLGLTLLSVVLAFVLWG